MKTEFTKKTNKKINLRFHGYFLSVRLDQNNSEKKKNIFYLFYQMML